MTKFSTELKLRTVRRYLRGESLLQLAREYGISVTTLKQWVKVYNFHGKKGFEKKQINYNEEFKLSVITYMETNMLSEKETAAYFGISCSTVYNWNKRYENHGIQGLTSKKRGRKKMLVKGDKEFEFEIEVPEFTGTREELEKELYYLRAENAYLKKLRALRLEAEAREKGRKK